MNLATTVVKLRDYQSGAIFKLAAEIKAGHRRVLLTLPTGAGKSVIAAELARKIQFRDECTLFIVPLISLVDQSVAQFERLGLTVGVIQGENTRHPNGQAADVYVCTIQSLNAKQGWPPLYPTVTKPVSLVIIDEAHRWFAAHTKLLRKLDRIATDADRPPVIVVGLTATPMKPGLADVFGSMVNSATIRQLTDDGYLVPLSVRCPNRQDYADLLADVSFDYNLGDYNQAELGTALTSKPKARKIIGEIVTTYQERGEGRQALAWAVNVAHAEALTAAFQAADIDADVVHYRRDNERERQPILQRFRDGELQVLVSVDSLGIGFDVPAAAVGIMARPTASPIVFIQQVGRILRPAPDKSGALLLDHAGNVYRFGLPVDFVPPKLTDELPKASRKLPKEPPVRECRECGAVIPLGCSTCPECGTDTPRRQPNVEQIDGRLVEYRDADIVVGKPVTSGGEWMLRYRMIRFEARRLNWPNVRGSTYHKLRNWYEREVKEPAPKYWPPKSWDTLPPVAPDRATLNELKRQYIAWNHSPRNPNNKAATDLR